jgi:hypothetical protein
VRVAALQALTLRPPGSPIRATVAHHLGDSDATVRDTAAALLESLSE